MTGYESSIVRAANSPGFGVDRTELNGLRRSPGFRSSFLPSADTTRS